MDYARKIELNHNGLQQRKKITQIDRFGDENRVNSINFNATTLKFPEKFDHPFFSNKPSNFLVIYFVRVTVLLLFRLQAVSKIFVPIYPYLISEGRRNC